jgi:hypothetical protein
MKIRARFDFSSANCRPVLTFGSLVRSRNVASFSSLVIACFLSFRVGQVERGRRATARWHIPRLTKSPRKLIDVGQAKGVAYRKGCSLFLHRNCDYALADRIRKRKTNRMNLRVWRSFCRRQRRHRRPGERGGIELPEPQTTVETAADLFIEGSFQWWV